MGNIENCFKQAKTLLKMKLLCEVVGTCILLKKNWQGDALINHAQLHPYHLQVVKDKFSFEHFNTKIECSLIALRRKDFF